MFLLSHVRVRSSRQEVFSVKRAFLEVSQNSQVNTSARVSFLKKRLWHKCFPANFTKFVRTHFLTEYILWLLLGFQSESTLYYSFRTSCSKQTQYLKFKNIAIQTQFKQVLFSFNENVLCQRGLDKYFWERFLLLSTFSCQCQNIKKETLRPSSQVLLRSSRTHHVSLLFKLFLNYLIFIVYYFTVH